MLSLDLQDLFLFIRFFLLLILYYKVGIVGILCSHSLFVLIFCSFGNFLFLLLLVVLVNFLDFNFILLLYLIILLKFSILFKDSLFP